MATIRGTITDRTSGEPAARTVHALASDGSFVHPDGLEARRGRDFFAGL